MVPKARKLAQAGGPTAEAQALFDAGDAAGAFALLANRQADPSPPKLLHRCALRWRDDCVAAVVAEVTKGSGGNLQLSPLPDPLARYLRRTGEYVPFAVWQSAFSACSQSSPDRLLAAAGSASGGYRRASTRCLRRPCTAASPSPRGSPLHRRAPPPTPSNAARRS